MSVGNSAILWGTNYENKLLVGRPVYNILTDRVPRAQSAWAQGPSGVEDAYIPGYDYTLWCEARWIPDGGDGSTYSALSGPTGWQAFFDWARQKNPFRFVPDANYQSFYVDACYLVNPLLVGGPLGSLDALTRRTIPFQIRNATVDFHQALRGIMWEYVSGSDITQPLAAAYGRSTAAGFLDNKGFFEQAAAGVLRDRHYPAGLGSTVRTTRIDATRSNKITSPENLSTWTTLQNLTVPSTNNPSPRNDGTASRLQEDSTNNFRGARFNFSLSGAGDMVGCIWFLKNNGRPLTELRINNGPSTSFFWCRVDLSAGTLVSSGAAGTATLSFAKITPLAGGWYKVEMYGKQSAVDTSVYSDIWLNNASTYVGDGSSGIYAWGCVAVDGRIAGEYWGTVATSNSDLLIFPMPAGMLVPQALWVYAKFVESGWVFGDPNYNTGGPFIIGATAGGLGGFGPGAGNAPGDYTVEHYNLAGTGSSIGIGGTAPSMGDTVELLALLNADGSMQLWRSTNGGAPVTGGVSAALALDSTWGDNNIGIGMRRGGVIGPNAVQIVRVGFGTAINTIAAARAA